MPAAISHRIMLFAACLLFGGIERPVAAEIAEALTRQSLGSFDDAELAAEQVAQIEALIEDFASRIEQAEAESAWTQEQLVARDAAVHEAIASGRKGAAAAALIEQAVNLSQQQKDAAGRAIRLQSEFDQAFDELLTVAQRNARDDRPGESLRYTGYLVIRIDPEKIASNANDTSLIDLANQSGLDSLVAIFDELGLEPPKRAVDPLALERIDPRHDELTQRLASYWRVDAGGLDTEDTALALDRLNTFDEVENAYRETSLSLAGMASRVDPHDDPYAFRQGYLDPSPSGVDAKHVWTLNQGTGSHVGLVQVDATWNPDHNDFADTPIQLVHGEIKPGDHGTAALGEVIGNDNTEGIVGVAPGTACVFLASYYNRAGYDEHIAPGVVAALPLMWTGDVLLLDVQRGGYPTEIDDLDFDAIRLAVADGMVVVEAAGNGRRPDGGGGQVGFNLDEYVQPETNDRILNRCSPGFRDSGAIMVGAADPRSGNDRLKFSCYGNRLDCFAWGKFVTSTGYGDLDDGGPDPNRSYTKKYHGTSSAAPIIAGAAISLQSLSIENRRRVIGPIEMRQMLSYHLTGTPQGSGRHGHIGVMPDLKKIVNRYSLGDTGHRRSTKTSKSHH